MFPLWVVVTLAAACLQVVRTGLQKSMSSELDALSATWVRYVYALPLLAPLLLALWFELGGLPALSPGFMLYCLAAGVSQIAATCMLLLLFDRRNFAVSMVFAKTEGMQTALLGALVFGEPASGVGLVGVGIGAVGILLLLPWGQLGLWGGSEGAARGARGTFGAVVLLGLGAGFFFALTVWFIRLSYGEIEAAALPAAVMTLTVMVLLQSLLLGVYLAWRRADFAAVWRLRRRGAAVGVFSLGGSLCWFWAFALTNPAYVKTLAQIELPLAFLLGRAAFAEKSSKVEIAGLLVAGVGAVVVVFA